MPSPFPGMDPYLEDPALWPDFHDRLAEQISAVLNGKLPQSYYAQLGAREEIGILGQGPVRRIIPDVAVVKASAGPFESGGGTALLVAEPRTELSEAIEIKVPTEKYNVPFIEIIDIRTGREVVTIIEILSPSNKLPGADHMHYVSRREEILESKTALIEIDLLRTGDRSFFGDEVTAALASVHPPPDYLAVVDRVSQTGHRFSRQIFPAWLQRPLPVIAVPLRPGEPESTLDLQYAFQQAYDRGPYRRGAVDYSRPPKVPLAPNLQGWAAEVLAPFLQVNKEASR